MATLLRRLNLDFFQGLGHFFGVTLPHSHCTGPDRGEPIPPRLAAPPSPATNSQHRHFATGEALFEVPLALGTVSHLEGQMSAALFRIERRVFEERHLFRGGTFGRRALQNHLDAEAREFERLLEAGCGCADTKAAAFCENLLELLPAVWRFVVTEGIEPTNNHAERLLRRGVLWRKNAFGCHSEGAAGSWSAS